MRQGERRGQAGLPMGVAWGPVKADSLLTSDFAVCFVTWPGDHCCFLNSAHLIRSKKGLLLVTRVGSYPENHRSWLSRLFISLDPHLPPHWVSVRLWAPPSKVLDTWSAFRRWGLSCYCCWQLWKGLSREWQDLGCIENDHSGLVDVARPRSPTGSKLNIKREQRWPRQG